MARILALTGAVARVAVREQRRLRGFAANNLLFLLYLLGQGGAGAFVFLLVGLVALFPLAGDPFRKLPAERVATWPVTPAELRLVRFVSVFLTPAAWIALAVIWWTGRPQFFLLALALAAWAIPFPRRQLFRWVPDWLGQLVRKNLRELLSLLDTWIAALLSVATVAYRAAAPQPPPAEAWTIMSIMIAFVMTTSAQCLFALDAGPGLDRYRLMPQPGWRVLAAKHAALLIVVLVLTLPLDPLPALAALLAAMAFGNHHAVTLPRLQAPWSLTAGSLAPGLVQSILSVAAGLHTARQTRWTLAGCAILYVVSTAFYGWLFDRRRSG